MARASLIERLYAVNKTPLEFHYDNLCAPPLYSLLSQTEVGDLKDIATSFKLSGKLDKKRDLMQEILFRRGFQYFHSGTNRDVYTFCEDKSIIIKVAFDKNCLSDNINEFNNQFLFKPFVTKVFETDPSGVIGVFERVSPITSRQEFISIAEDVFNMLNSKFIGKFILEDVGSKYFMNYGLRTGFGPVLLDFPYVYELDGNKLSCNAIIDGEFCGGLIDYDDGFNKLVCPKCGRKYDATELKKAVDKEQIILVGPEGDNTMKISYYIGNKKINEIDNSKQRKTYEQAKSVDRLKISTNIDSILRKEEKRKLYEENKVDSEEDESFEEKPVYDSNDEVSTHDTNSHDEVSVCTEDTDKSSYQDEQEEQHHDNGNKPRPSLRISPRSLQGDNGMNNLF